MKQNNKHVSIALAIVLIISLAFVIADYVITPSTFSINESINSLYNITFLNSESGQEANITQVNITLPSNFTFTADTNGTNASDMGHFINFTNLTGNILIWENQTEGSYVINGSNSSTFWFNATATPGDYNLTVSFLNITDTYTSNISVTINDTTNPTANLGVNLTDNYNSTSSSVTFDLNCTDNYALSVLQLWTNTTGTWHANQTNSSYVNGSYWNVTVSDIADGIYIWAAYCNDSANNSDWSANRTLTVDTTAPNMTLIAPSNATSSTTSTYNFTFNVTENTTSIANCSLIIDNVISNTTTSVSVTAINGIYNSSLSVGTHNWSINCTDVLGNRGNTTNRTLTVTAASTAASTTPSSGSSSLSPILKITSEQLTQGYTKVMYKDWTFEFEINNETHSFKVDEVTETNAKISVSSDIQEKVFEIGDEQKFNIDEDENYDLYVKLNDIKTYYSQIRANFTIQSIDEAPEKKSGVVEEVKAKIQETISEKGKNWIGIGLVIAVIIIAIIIILKNNFLKSKKRK